MARRRFVPGARPSDTGSLLSCSYDIVKRVVTVKQASAAGGGWGLGMGMQYAGARASAERRFMLGLEAGRTARSRWTWRPVAGVLVCLLSSVFCSLPSARIWGYRLRAA